MKKLTIKLTTAALALAAGIGLLIPTVSLTSRPARPRAVVAASQSWYICIATGGAVHGVWLPDLGLCTPRTPSS